MATSAWGAREWNAMQCNAMEWNDNERLGREGMEWNGTQCNGMEWNDIERLGREGMECNAMQWNGMTTSAWGAREWNGMECNGIERQRALGARGNHLGCGGVREDLSPLPRRRVMTIRRRRADCPSSALGTDGTLTLDGYASAYGDDDAVRIERAGVAEREVGRYARASE